MTQEVGAGNEDFWFTQTLSRLATDSWGATKVPLPKSEIIVDIEGQIEKMGGNYNNWYVGLAKDCQESFFQSHLLEDRNDGFLYREAFTAVCAREIKDYFVTELGASLDPSNSDGGRIVYAYRKTPVESGKRVGNGNFDLVR